MGSHFLIDEWTTDLTTSCCTLAAVSFVLLSSQHARRLYPLKVSPKVSVEWGYAAGEGDSWTTVDKSVLTDAPDGIEKKIGFEGKPDPSTGFYCVSTCCNAHALRIDFICNLF